MPKITILMGVSGCGKTTVGRLLSKKTGIPFFDADDFHPEINIKKMKSHEPLTDEDRRPWLVSLAKKVVDWSTENGAILACSALKESYRKLLGANTHINWVYLKGTFAVINQRMENRNHHFMKSTLLKSQFDTLEEPGYGLIVDIDEPINTLVQTIADSLQLNS